MEQIINYRDIPTDKRIDILNALERIGLDVYKRQLYKKGKAELRQTS